MKISEMAEWLNEHSDLGEVFVRLPDGYLHDFRVVIQDEVFDGFDTVYPASITIEPID